MVYRTSFGMRTCRRFESCFANAWLWSNLVRFVVWDDGMLVQIQPTTCSPMVKRPITGGFGPPISGSNPDRTMRGYGPKGRHSAPNREMGRHPPLAPLRRWVSDLVRSLSCYLSSRQKECRFKSCPRRNDRILLSRMHATRPTLSPR